MRISPNYVFVKNSRISFVDVTTKTKYLETISDYNMNFHAHSDYIMRKRGIYNKNRLESFNADKINVIQRTCTIPFIVLINTAV